MALYKNGEDIVIPNTGKIVVDGKVIINPTVDTLVRLGYARYEVEDVVIDEDIYGYI